MAKAQGNRQARESLERVLKFAIGISKYTRQRSALNQALKAGAATKEVVLRAADSDFDLPNELAAILARYTFVATVDGPNALRFRGRFDADSFACNLGVVVKEERKRISRGRASSEESSEEADDVWSRLWGDSPGERWFLPEPASRPLPEELAIKGSPVEPEVLVDYEDLTSFMYEGRFNEADAVLVVFQLAQQNYISNLRICTMSMLFLFEQTQSKILPTTPLLPLPLLECDRYNQGVSAGGGQKTPQKREETGPQALEAIGRPTKTEEASSQMIRSSSAGFERGRELQIDEGRKQEAPSQSWTAARRRNAKGNRGVVGLAAGRLV